MTNLSSPRRQKCYPVCESGFSFCLIREFRPPAVSIARLWKYTDVYFPSFDVRTSVIQSAQSFKTLFMNVPTVRLVYFGRTKPNPVFFFSAHLYTLSKSFIQLNSKNQARFFAVDRHLVDHDCSTNTQRNNHRIYFSFLASRTDVVLRPIRWSIEALRLIRASTIWTL